MLNYFEYLYDIGIIPRQLSPSIFLAYVFKKIENFLYFFVNKKDHVRVEEMVA